MRAPDEPHELDAVERQHLKIGDDEVRALPAQNFERFAAVGGGRDVLDAHGVKHELQKIAHLCAVFDDQGFQGFKAVIDRHACAAFCVTPS